MCTTGEVINGNKTAYVKTCGQFAAALNCRLNELIPHGNYNSLDADDCLCGCDVYASGIKFKFYSVQDGDIDFVVKKDDHQ